MSASSGQSMPFGAVLRNRNGVAATSTTRPKHRANHPAMVAASQLMQLYKIAPDAEKAAAARIVLTHPEN